MNRTFYSVSTGCRLNMAETQALDRKLFSLGLTKNESDPSLIIINSCAITAKAEREIIQLSNNLRKKFPQARLIVTGCAATRWLQQKKPVPSADLLVPNTDKHRLVTLLDLAPEPMQSGSNSSDHPRPQTQTDKFTASGRVFIKIQDGCHRFCSYCVVPYLRLSPRSTPISEIINQINSLSPEPTEVVCTAVNTEAFGKDTGETIIQLISELLSKTRIKRVAFGSVHPWTVTPAFISYYRNTLSKEPRFVQFFHVPVQSGSQSVLNLMKRDYQLDKVLDSLSQLRSIRPDVFISTDVIVGYLGETDELFEETYSTLRNSPISRFHVFPFSARKGTAAAYLAGRLSEPTAQQKKHRSQLLRKLSEQKYKAFLASLALQSAEALVISHAADATRVLLHNNVELQIPLHRNALPGSLVHVTIKT